MPRLLWGMALMSCSLAPGLEVGAKCGMPREPTGPFDVGRVQG